MFNINNLKKILIGILSILLFLYVIIIINLGFNHEEFIYNLEHFFITSCFIYWLIYIKEGTFISKYITNNYYFLIFFIILQLSNVILTLFCLFLFLKSGDIDILCLGVISWSETFFNYIINSVNCMEGLSNTSIKEHAELTKQGKRAIDSGVEGAFAFGSFGGAYLVGAQLSNAKISGLMMKSVPKTVVLGTSMAVGAATVYDKWTTNSSSVDKATVVVKSTTTSSKPPTLPSVLELFTYDSSYLFNIIVICSLLIIFYFIYR
jgi:hypothetical protein